MPVPASPQDPVVPPPEDVKVVVVRRDLPPVAAPDIVVTPVVVAPAPIPDPPAVPAGIGKLTISAVPAGFEIWVDGKLANKGPLSRTEYPAGEHTIVINLDDGRTKTFTVHLAADQEIRRIWDFDSGEFRR